MAKEKNTEERIKEAAKNVFIKKGLAGARMQDIANEAKINKAMLHYYFRSKQKLFESIFEDQFSKLLGAILFIFSSDLSFEEKIRQFVKTEIDIVSELQMLPIFIINEINQNPTMLEEMLKNKPIHLLTKQFKKVLNAEIKQGNIREISVELFFMDLLSLCIFPIMAAPMIKKVFKLSDKKYKNLIEERKTHVTDLLIRHLRK